MPPFYWRSSCWCLLYIDLRACACICTPPFCNHPVLMSETPALWRQPGALATSALKAVGASASECPVCFVCQLTSACFCCGRLRRGRRNFPIPRAVLGDGQSAILRYGCHHTSVTALNRGMGCSLKHYTNAAAYSSWFLGCAYVFGPTFPSLNTSFA